MVKKTAKKVAKKSSAKRALAKAGVKTKRAAAIPPKKSPVKLVKAAAKAKVPAESGGEKLTFNHAMIYVKDVQKALGFYRDLLGFKMVDEFRFENQPVYARLRAPGGDGTIALHMAGPSDSLVSNGVRLYFEIHDVDGFCRKLQTKGFYITQMPRMMPWGWRHAYLNDPDGHEISLYWAGEKRMEKTMMQVAKKIEKTPRQSHERS